MKRLLKITAIFAVISALFTSCADDDGYSLDKYWLSYGVIKGTPENFNIELDNGSVLYISASNVFIHPDSVINNMRVVANYTILGDMQKNESGKVDYMVKLNSIASILSKDPVMSSTADLDALGNDPIDVVDIWFGGKFLNFKFNLYMNSKVHFINLLVDETNPNADADNVYVILKHNAYGDAKNAYRTGFVSFDLTSLLPEGKNTMKVHVSFVNYDGKTIEDSGTFVLGADQSPKNIMGVDAATVSESPAIK